MRQSVLAVLAAIALIATGCGSPTRQSDTADDVVFHGLSLKDAPRTTSVAELGNLFQEDRPGSGSYKMRADVVQVYSGIDGTVYHLPDKNKFFVQHDPIGSSTLTYYGPFDGDPATVMDLPKSSSE